MESIFPMDMKPLKVIHIQDNKAQGTRYWTGLSYGLYFPNSNDKVSLAIERALPVLLVDLARS